MLDAAVIGAVVRAILQVAAGSAVAGGVVSDSDITVAAGAVTALVSLAWSIYQKVKARK